MASNERVRKVSEQIRRDLVSIIPDCIYHDKISFISVSGIELSRDFKYATLYVTYLGDKGERTQMVDLLNQHAGSIRYQLAQRLSTRTVPEMTFVYDESVEYGARMENLLRDLVEDIPEEE